jgi:hypothetical protein
VFDPIRQGLASDELHDEELQSLAVFETVNCAIAAVTISEP